jgi:hypothetical protein
MKPEALREKLLREVLDVSAGEEATVEGEVLTIRASAKRLGEIRNLLLRMERDALEASKPAKPAPKVLPAAPEPGKGE